MSTYNPVTEEVLLALREALGTENVKIDEETLDRYKTDEETDPRYHHLPEVVVLPGSTEEVAAVMKIANKYLVPVTPRTPYRLEMRADSLSSNEEVSDLSKIGRAHV